MDKINLKALQKLKDEAVISDAQFLQFAEYIELLKEWNKRTNLISKNDVSRIVEKHITESFVYADYLKATDQFIMDLGTGAGFPGIPVKILKPDFEIHLVESKRIKVLFLKEVIDRLRLTNVFVYNERVEEFKSSRRYDVIMARAVSELKKLWIWSHPHLKENGRVLTLKGGDLDQEVKDLQDFDGHVHVEINTKKDQQGNEKLMVILD